MSGEGAARLGERLLAEVEGEELSAVLRSVREAGWSREQSANNPSTTQQPPFNIPNLNLSQPSPAILELVSRPPTHHPSGAGKTSLLYHLIAHALLPPLSPSGLPLHGHGAAIILFDPLDNFSIPRLARMMLHNLHALSRSSRPPADPATHPRDLKHIVQASLLHLHIFRPHAWTDMLHILHDLSAYLFAPGTHQSTQRAVHAIVLDDIDAFTPELRNTSSTTTATNPLTTASVQLTTALIDLVSLLSCAIVLTSSCSSSTAAHSALRPVFPTSWPQGVVPTRVGVQRVEVLPFAPGMSGEEAEAEKGQRREVVRRGRFEWWRVGGGSGKEREGGVFRVGECGVEFEDAETGE